MKLEVYEDTHMSTSEKVVRLRLMNDCGWIKLCAVDEDGEPLHRGVLLRITDKGEFSEAIAINPDLGIELCSNSVLGRIKIV